MAMEQTRYIITILMIASKNASSHENATFNISGLNNFNEMIDKLIAENESTVTVPPENKSGKEVSEETDSAQRVLSNDNDANSMFLDKHHEISSIVRNITNDLNNKLNDSKIIYINEILPHNATLAERIEFPDNDTGLPEFFNSRRSFGDNATYNNFFKQVFDRPVVDDRGRGIVVEEEFSFEIEDDKPIHALKAFEAKHNNKTFQKMFIPPVAPFQGGHMYAPPFTLPPTRTTTHKNNEIGLRASKPMGVQNAMFPMPNQQDNSLKLLTELSKINTKINGVEDLLKKNIGKENIDSKFLQSGQNSELVKSDKNFGLLRTNSPQGIVPYRQAIYQPALPNPIGTSSVLSLQKRLIEERTRNRLLNLRLEKIARAKHYIALLNELTRARSRLIVHLPVFYQQL